MKIGTNEKRGTFNFNYYYHKDEHVFLICLFEYILLSLTCDCLFKNLTKQHRNIKLLSVLPPTVQLSL